MNLPLYFITLYLNAAIILTFPIYQRQGQAVAPIALRNLYLKCCPLSNFFIVYICLPTVLHPYVFIKLKLYTNLYLSF